MVRDRPAVDHDETDQNLPVARLTVAAVAMGSLGRSLALEIGRGQIVEHHVDAQRKQVAQGDKQRVLDLRLARQQLIERAVPVLELPRRDPHPWRPARLALGVVAPRRQEAAATAIAHEVGLQPARQAMLAGRRGEPIGNQRQNPIAQRGGIATTISGESVERRLKPKFNPQVARRQHRSEVPRRHGVNVLAPDRAGLAMQQACQLGEIEMRRQQVLATQIEDGAMPRLAAVAIGFDHPHIFVLDALAAGGADDAQEHGPSEPCPRHQHQENQQLASTNVAITEISLSLRFGENRTPISAKSMIWQPRTPPICQTWANDSIITFGLELLEATEQSVGEIAYGIANAPIAEAPVAEVASEQDQAGLKRAEDLVRQLRDYEAAQNAQQLQLEHQYEEIEL